MQGRSGAAEILEGILEDEKAADAKPTALAEGGINQHAVDAGIAAAGGAAAAGGRRRVGTSRNTRSKSQRRARRIKQQGH